MKFKKSEILISTLACFIPLIAGLLLWNRLPDVIATHFNANGEADGFMSKPMAVTVLPVFIGAINLLALFVTSHDPRREGQSEKILKLVLWLCPVVSVFTGFMIYSKALGNELNVNGIVNIMMGLLFTVIGNYLPKTRQSYTIGIKVPWTLDSEENWIRTHRMAGPLWMAGGILVMIFGFIPGIPFWVMMAVLLLMGAVPVIYSFILYRKGI